MEFSTQAPRYVAVVYPTMTSSSRTRRASFSQILVVLDRFIMPIRSGFSYRNRS